METRAKNLCVPRAGVKKEQDGGQQGGPRGRSKDMGPPKDWIDEGVTEKESAEATEAA